jgi:hypothetical protein
MDYPFQQVTLAILNDDHWEPKNYGASTVFLYKNRGDWMNQLRRGLYAQWFGVYLNEGQWAHSRPIKFLQTALHFQLTDSLAGFKTDVDDPQTPFTTVYDQFSVKNWNFWQKHKTWRSPNTKNIASDLMKSLLKKGSATITPEIFKDDWYQTSGQPEIKLPSYQPKMASNNDSTANNDTSRYEVNFNLNEKQDSLKLVFKATRDTLYQSTNLPVTLITDSSKQNKQVSFEGARDSAWITLPGGTKNVRFQVPDQQKLQLTENKPADYSLYQLQHADEAKERARAAKELGHHTNNADLQLALVSAMKREKSPEV